MLDLGLRIEPRIQLQMSAPPRRVWVLPIVLEGPIGEYVLHSPPHPSSSYGVLLPQRLQHFYHQGSVDDGDGNIADDGTDVVLDALTPVFGMDGGPAFSGVHQIFVPNGVESPEM